MTNLYLDVDGVLLTAKNTQAAEGVNEFVDFVTAHFQCFWLTTHCKGNAATVLRYLAAFLPAAIVAKLEDVKATNWKTIKTEGIELTADFYWLDDNPLQAEQQALKANGLIARLLTVDLRRSGELVRLQKLLQYKLRFPITATSL